MEDKEVHVWKGVELRSISVIPLVDNKIKQLNTILMINRQDCLQTSGTGENG